MHLLRLLKILRVSLRFGLDEFFLGHERVHGLRSFISALFFWRKLERPRGERLRLALEALGPIFVKFGQVLSTRRDLIPLDIADELIDHGMNRGIFHNVVHKILTCRDKR